MVQRVQQCLQPDVVCIVDAPCPAAVSRISVHRRNAQRQSRGTPRRAAPYRCLSRLGKRVRPAFSIARHLRFSTLTFHVFASARLEPSFELRNRACCFGSPTIVCAVAAIRPSTDRFGKISKRFDGTSQQYGPAFPWLLSPLRVSRPLAFSQDETAIRLRDGYRGRVAGKEGDCETLIEVILEERLVRNSKLAAICEGLFRSGGLHRCLRPLEASPASGSGRGGADAHPANIRFGSVVGALSMVIYELTVPTFLIFRT